MKVVELYGRVRYAVQIEGLSRREAAHTATKTNAAVITQSSSLFETERSGHTPALNPHRPTPLPARRCSDGRVA
jgi:hypothetical protein